MEQLSLLQKCPWHTRFRNESSNNHTTNGWQTITLIRIVLFLRLKPKLLFYNDGKASAVLPPLQNIKRRLTTNNSYFSTFVTQYANSSNKQFFHLSRVLDSFHISILTFEVCIRFIFFSHSFMGEKFLALIRVNICVAFHQSSSLSLPLSLPSVGLPLSPSILPLWLCLWILRKTCWGAPLGDGSNLAFTYSYILQTLFSASVVWARACVCEHLFYRMRERVMKLCFVLRFNFGDSLAMWSFLAANIKTCFS